MPTDATTTITLVAFLMASSAVLLVFTLVRGRSSRVDARLKGLATEERSLSISGSGPGSGFSSAAQPARGLPGDPMREFARAALPKMGTPLVPTNEEERSRLKTQMIHAGLYGRQAMPIYLGVKMLLMVSPALIGLSLGMIGLVPPMYGLLGGACFGIAGMIGPSFWLDHKKKSRQLNFRRSLPDALDVLVICLEGGLSLTGSLRRVSDELQTAHPSLATELNIVQREIQLGRSTGEALQQMGIRSDLEEVRSLASVITQAEKYGASLVKSLRIHAETLRLKRQQQAEEMAQKAATKVLFPTLLFIFPAIFVVILGPAAFQIMEMFADMN
ncbi:type II secretion system F family protein [soil metagenome]